MTDANVTPTRHTHPQPADVGRSWKGSDRVCPEVDRFMDRIEAMTVVAREAPIVMTDEDIDW